MPSPTTLLLLLFLLPPPALSASLSLALPTGKSHCLYTALQAQEHLTADVFVKSGAAGLTVRLVIDGPILTEWDENPGTLFKASNGVVVSDTDDDEGAPSVEFFNEVVDMASVAAKEEKMTDEELLANEEEDDTFRRTITAPLKGIYRTCLKNDVGGWGAKVVELAVRQSWLEGSKSETLLDENGHVPVVYVNKNSDKTGLAEGAEIEDADIRDVFKWVRQLRAQMDTIAKRQSHERHRLNIHTATNEASHSRMVVGSLFETVVFIAVASAQVFTLRSWFGGKNKGGLLDGNYGGGKASNWA